MKNRRFIIAASALILLFTTGCFRKFYKTNSVSIPDSARLETARDSGKIVFVHYKDSIVHFDNVSISRDTIKGNARKTKQNARYMHPSATKPNVMKKIDRSLVFSQIHIYLDENAPPDENEIDIHNSQIVRYDVYGPDKKATKRSTTISIIGFAIVLVAWVTLFIGLLSAGVALGG